jgi:hypothetical protein
MKAINLLLAILISPLAFCQSFNEKLNREVAFEKRGPENTVIVANINGDVNIVGYNGDKVILEVDRNIYAKTDARLEKGKQEVQLGMINNVDTLVFYVDDGCTSFSQNRNRNKRDRWSSNRWGYDWNCNNGNCRPEYNYKMDFTLKVPSNVNVIVSTVNDGDIKVEGVSGAIKADNVNGSIKLAKVVRESSASTINGDVDIEYTAQPGKDCRFYSLNGDINAYFPKGLAANMSFESFNGDFYTNVEKIQQMPATIEKSEKGDGIKYKVSGNRYKIGNGGVFLDFETFNGNVYLKEKI